MRTTSRRAIAFASASLLTAVFSFAQTNDHLIGGPPYGIPIALADNAVADSFKRAVIRSMVAAFSLTGPECAAGQGSGDPFPELAQANPQQQTNPPATNQAPPSLGDLGFPTAQTQGNTQEQARLDRRSHMLKIHQRLGLITAVPLIATVITGTMAGGKSTSSTTRDLHASLGSVTAGLYFTTAYFSLFAPRVAGTKTRGPIRLHKALAWIHGPGMILTPMLGAMAFEQKSQGEKIHGIASAHGAVAIVTAAAYGLAIASVSLKF
jgi:hypothetical protein